ncbi:MAG: hypothetical protein NPINA01_11840 [Nitrospinaceae bacterium]|nr:MAG: hypothetical protein NPINA01_11840 [Nitrospinaceae bacterium]
MLKRLVLIYFFAAFFTGILLVEGEKLLWGQTHAVSWGAFSAVHLPGDSSDEACGEKVQPAEYFSQVSLVSLIAAFGLVFAGIFIDKKPVKFGVWGLAVLPFALWAYINYFVDYDRMKRLAFTYNTVAENTLANIAEAQDRYKSEQDTFLKDLEQLYSHMAGSHGINQCVRILKIEAEWNRWSAQARHVSSPDKVTWDSRTGSSLKKG